MVSRRIFCLLLAEGAWSLIVDAEEPVNRKLDFQIGEGFEALVPKNVEAVLRSAGEAIWQHCPNTHWEFPGFHIYFRGAGPIILKNHRDDGRVAVGLNVRGAFWAQFAYQFAHEFCHALAWHSNDWKKIAAPYPSATLWLEESICEAASLFALRAMRKTWEVSPPYRNWESFAPKLTDYSDERLAVTKPMLEPGVTFQDWFKREADSLSTSGTQREKNTLIASQLLPLFEAEPSGWESMTYYYRVEPNACASLEKHFAAWSAASPEAHRNFISKLAAVFGAS